jgi:hypothetical protein
MRWLLVNKEVLCRSSVFRHELPRKLRRQIDTEY